MLLLEPLDLLDLAAPQAGRTPGYPNAAADATILCFPLATLP